MKHFHCELIKAWADGAEIQAKDGYGNWGTLHQPNWDYDCEYRIKPVDLPDGYKQWDYDTRIDVTDVNLGDVLGYFFLLKDGGEQYIGAGGGLPDRHQDIIGYKPLIDMTKTKKPVVRWLWADDEFQVCNYLMSEEENCTSFTTKLEWSRTEFPE